MNKLYLLAAVVALVFMAYLYGVNIADAKCRLRNSQENLIVIQNYQKQITQTKRLSRDTVYKIGAGDIRRILRDKYSIAE